MPLIGITDRDAAWQDVRRAVCRPVHARCDLSVRTPEERVLLDPQFHRGRVRSWDVVSRRACGCGLGPVTLDPSFGCITATRIQPGPVLSNLCNQGVKPSRFLSCMAGEVD